jgi:hypothetical protein
MDDNENSKETSQSVGKGPVGKEGHTVKQGECVESIAFEHGLFWETIWNDSKNAELKQARENPNALLPGDKIYIREKEEKEFPGASEKKHRFRRKGVPAIFQVKLLDSENKARANLKYTLVIDGDTTFTGTTDGGGKLEHRIGPNAKKGKLTVGEGKDKEEYDFNLKHLDPVEEPTGIQARLANLGYYHGRVDGKIGPRTKAALGQFQSEHGLKETGQADKATIDKLKEVYGS